MGLKIKDTKLHNRESRRGLAQRDEPYWRLISEGLYIGYRKGPRGGVWRVRRLADGKYTKASLGQADDVLDADGTQVLDWSQAQEAAQAFDRDIKQSDGIIRSPLTVSKAIERYMEDYRARAKAAGIATAQGFINAHILPAFGEREVSSLTSDDIKSWFNKVATKPARLRTGKGVRKQAHREKPKTDDEKRARQATANRVLTVLKAILNKTFHDNLVPTDAAWRRVKPFKNTDDGAIRYLKPDESTRLVNTCPVDLRALVRGALYTGARFGELARLTVADVDTIAARVYISPASKSGKPRHVPLNQEGTQFLADLIAGRPGTERVFLKADGTSWGHNHHMRAFVQANADARISPPARFHDLRHSYATMIANLPGNTLDVLAEILGHADTRITRKHYAFLFDDTKKRAVANLPSLGYESTGKVTALQSRAA
jgi:integrase